MRLWHKSLINVLPKKQFLGQIRELTAICKDIQNNGKTNHILINRIKKYIKKHEKERFKRKICVKSNL